MNRKRKIGILLVLIGIGIPSVLYFFQDNGVLFTIHRIKIIEKVKTEYINTLLGTIPWTKEERKRLSEMPEKESYPLLVKLAEQDMQAIVMQRLMVKALAFFQEDLEIVTVTTRKDIPIPYRQFIGVGILIALIGLGMFIFSFFPGNKPKKIEVEE